MRKLFLLLFFLTVFLSSCRLQQKPAVPSDEKLTKVAIQLDGSATPYYVPLYLAESKGWFAENGLDIEFYYAPAVEIVKNVAMGNIPFGFPNADLAVIGKGNNIPVKIIHSTYQQGLGSILFKKSSGIKTPKDLKGKTIAITSYGSPNYSQLQVILQKNNLSIEDVIIKIIGTGAIVNSLVSDQVDAICFSMLRAYDLQDQGIEVAELRFDDYVASSGNVLITSDQFLKDNPVVCIKMTSVLDRALDYLINQNGLAEGIQLAIENHAPASKGSEARITKVIENEFIPHLWQSQDTKKYGFGYSNIEKYNQYIRLLSEYGLIEDPYFAEELVVRF